MKLVRVYADESGETHLAEIELPSADDLAGEAGNKLLALRDIAATTVTISQLLGHRQDLNYHTPARRQIVALLGGELEVTTTTGETQRLQAGDCLLADDLGSKGHISKSVGDEPWATLVVGIATGWQVPSADQSQI